MKSIVRRSQESEVRSQKPEAGSLTADSGRRMTGGGQQKMQGRARLSRIAAYCLLLSAYYLLPTIHCPPVHAQQVVDKMVATIDAEELITYSDLLWQLALEPDAPLDRPRTEDLQRTLQRVIDQRLLAMEAEKLPIPPTDEEINAALTELIRLFPSRAEFEERLRRVGLTAEQLREVVLRRRVAIEKYINFRFRSFTFPTQQEIADYYRDVYVPRKRRSEPGRIVPKLEEAQAEVQIELTESRVASDIDEFLESARAGAAIVYLNSLGVK